MREWLSVSWLAVLVGGLWVVLGLFTAVESPLEWGIGVLITAAGAVALYIGQQSVPSAAEQRRWREMAEAMREGLYK